MAENIVPGLVGASIGALVGGYVGSELTKVRIPQTHERILGDMYVEIIRNGEIETRSLLPPKWYIKYFSFANPPSKIVSVIGFEDITKSNLADDWCDLIIQIREYLATGKWILEFFARATKKRVYYRGILLYSFPQDGSWKRIELTS